MNANHIFTYLYLICCPLSTVPLYAESNSDLAPSYQKVSESLNLNKIYGDSFHQNLISFSNDLGSLLGIETYYYNATIAQSKEQKVSATPLLAEINPNKLILTSKDSQYLKKISQVFNNVSPFKLDSNSVINNFITHFSQSENIGLSSPYEFLLHECALSVKSSFMDTLQNSKNIEENELDLLYEKLLSNIHLFFYKYPKSTIFSLIVFNKIYFESSKYKPITLFKYIDSNEDISPFYFNNINLNTLFGKEFSKDMALIAEMIGFILYFYSPLANKKTPPPPFETNQYLEKEARLIIKNLLHNIFYIKLKKNNNKEKSILTSNTLMEFINKFEYTIKKKLPT